MIYLCRCGKFKPGQPFHNAATKVWLCDICKRKQINTQRKAVIILEEKRVLLRRVMLTTSALVVKR